MMNGGENITKQYYYDYGRFAGFSKEEIDNYLKEKTIKYINTKDILMNYKVENNNLNYWSKDKNNQFTKEEILEYFNSNKKENNIPYSSISEKIEDKDYHISRIVYFMKHKENITNISLFDVGNGYDSIDGLHRSLAGYCLCLDKIKCIILGDK